MVHQSSADGCILIVFPVSGFVTTVCMDNGYAKVRDKVSYFATRFYSSCDVGRTDGKRDKRCVPKTTGLLDYLTNLVMSA
jgi:hypothetical protein